MKTKKKYKLWDILRVSWIDASTDEDWQFLKDLDKKAIRVETVGFYLDQTKDSIIISRSRSSDVGLEGRFNIPWVMIEKINKLRS